MSDSEDDEDGSGDEKKRGDAEGRSPSSLGHLWTALTHLSLLLRIVLFIKFPETFRNSSIRRCSSSTASTRADSPGASGDDGASTGR